MSDTRTEVEKHHDDLMAKRREMGKAKYGHGLQHSGTIYDWNRMALEESMDMSQYLACQNLLQHEWLVRIITSNDGVDREAAIKYVRDQMIARFNVNYIPKAASDHQG